MKFQSKIRGRGEAEAAPRKDEAGPQRLTASMPGKVVRVLARKAIRLFRDKALRWWKR